MKRKALTDALARDGNLPTSQAADQVDAAVALILRKLKKGKAVPLPGLGAFLPGPQPRFEFERRKSAASKAPREPRRGRR